MRVTQNASFPEARRNIEERNNVAKGHLYATVTKRGVQTATRSVSCQKDYTWARYYDGHSALSTQISNLTQVSVSLKI